MLLPDLLLVESDTKSNRKWGNVLISLWLHLPVHTLLCTLLRFRELMRCILWTLWISYLILKNKILLKINKFYSRSTGIWESYTTFSCNPWEKFLIIANFVLLFSSLFSLRENFHLLIWKSFMKNAENGENWSMSYLPFTFFYVLLHQADSCSPTSYFYSSCDSFSFFFSHLNEQTATEIIFLVILWMRIKIYSTILICLTFN